MAVNRLKAFLNDNKIKYISSFHSNAYTAQEVAASAHIPGRKIAKTVMVKIDGKMAMAVLSASDKVDFDLIQEAAGASKAELAGEQEFADLFLGCHIGAIPPFGNLYEMQVIVDEKLSEQTEIVFNAGSYTELITLHYEDFKNLVKPCVASISADN
ncbi:MAG: YbaK/EbsC family protein [Candidatus Scalindua sp.]|nr:YbaK/EbsC family protein [Candidatus Scalindua sp.]MBT5303493.1 YbaK/EbsC family protein [Candidatus Scalindua sp.]MBT6051870.1 YbaK/EbsC family protein [Candidatus Scalindua sp.]MBT6227347.1 YbaK/EbsC family protein [Candidatus Scalindua sp.]MBT6562796.1 YbaK/EbsC family protein [Candidatus Scalindua sp.]